MGKPPLFFIVLLVLVILAPVIAFGVPASPDAMEVVQPDGTIVKVHQRGDEWNNWVETLDGYTIEKGPDGYWRYVVGYENGKTVLSPAKADDAPPPGLQRSIKRVRGSRIN
jgi:hypothetical protein